MLTWYFILTLTFSVNFGGGGDAQIMIKTENEKTCTALRRAVWSQLGEMSGWLSRCRELVPAETLLPERD